MDESSPSAESVEPGGSVQSEMWHDDDEEFEDEGLDPRVEDELEALNSAAESINRLENEVQKARSKFRLMKTEYTQKLHALSKTTGRKWIIKARPYFDLLSQSQRAQQEAQKSTIKFRKANSFYRAAKETVTLAEQQVVTEDGHTVVFDSAWQEMLNHATMKFMEAEKEKAACELDHEQKAKEYAVIQHKLNFLVKDMPRTINRARAFYELKETLQSRLQAERQNAEDLHLALICSKQKYKMALNSLENISEEVHQSRRLRLQLPLWRTPGVGAESDACSEMSDMPSANLGDFLSETASQVSFEDFSEDGSWSPHIDVDFTLGDDWSDPDVPPVVLDATGKTDDTNSLWARLGNGFSRMTQEIGKISNTKDDLEKSMLRNGKLAAANNIGMVRDDTVDGAEDQGMTERTSPIKKNAMSPKRRIVRSVSCEQLVMPMSVANLGAQDPMDGSPKLSQKPPLPPSSRKMSVSSLKSGVYVAHIVQTPESSNFSTVPAQAKQHVEPSQQQFPILYDLKTVNYNASLPTWKPISFIQNLQTKKTKTPSSNQGSPLRSAAQAKVETLDGPMKSSKGNTELSVPTGEEIFV